MTLRQVYLVAVLLAFSALATTEDEANNELWDRLDTDSDGVVTSEELKGYAFWERSKDLREDMEMQWETFDLDPEDKLTFERYKAKTYDDDIDSDLGAYGRTIQQDQTRFNVSDGNKDGVLDKDEFMAFLWAEEFPQMHDLIVKETIDDLDKDEDGSISYKEYIGEHGELEDFEQDTEFTEELDKDHDGKLDPAEVKEWILGPTLDVFKEDEEKVATVMSKLDKDKDGKLTRKEIEDDPEVLAPLRFDEDHGYMHDEF